jgi:hypothetical protein
MIPVGGPKAKDTVVAGQIMAPIIVGVIGKRELAGKDAGVRSSIAAAFEKLDRDFPLTPKILLSGLADGADRIAADEARRRTRWTLVGVLAFAPEIYAQDFGEASLEWFEECIRDPKVRVHVLPALTDPATGRAFEPSAISRRAGASNPSRSPHYEQVGLYIANAAAIFVAVMPKYEMPGKIGGTARIVNYRVHGVLDDRAKDVIHRSQVLPPQPPIRIGHPGACWLIDVQRPAAGPAQQIPDPFEIVLAHEFRLINARERIKLSLQLADDIDDFNRLMPARPSPAANSRDRPQVDAVLGLRRLRREVAAIQRRLKKRVQIMIWLLAGLFTLAISAWELFVEREYIAWGKAGIFLYFGSVASAVVFYLIFSWGRWQSTAENYRAVAEALRVQIAWWEAGLSQREHRVEQYYLSRARGSLGRVREFVSSLINSVLLEADSLEAAPGSETVWIDEQIRYFSVRVSQREAALVAIEVGSWLLFIASFGTALFLMILSSPLRSAIQVAHVWLRHYSIFGSAILGVVFIILGVWLMAWFLPQTIVRHTEQQRPAMRGWAWIFALMLGFACAFAIYNLTPVDLPDTSIAWIGFSLIISAAIAGAMRFLSEKLSLDAELRGYENALEIFMSAKAALADLESPHRAISQGRGQREEILLSLGKEALAESEAWLRAHRERPLEPVLGA